MNGPQPVPPQQSAHTPTERLAEWKLLLASFAGGLLGSAARAGVQAAFGNAGLPAWGAHLAINGLGAFAAGWLFARWAAADAAGTPIGLPHVRRVREHLWSVGVLGGFTTVSGFAWDAVQALGEGDHAHLAVILAFNGVVGIAAAAVGWKIGK